MNDLTVGIALGRLSTRGGATVLIDGDWVEIRLLMVPGATGTTQIKTLALDDLFLLLQAEEVRV